MVDVAKREDRMLDVISAQKKKLDEVLLRLDFVELAFPAAKSELDEIRKVIVSVV